MRSSTPKAGAVIAGLCLSATPLAAQLLNPDLGGRPNYNVQSMNFDLWCQETQRYPAERCDQRLAADVREFEEYRAIIERYELQHLMEQQRDAEALEQADRNYGAPWEIYDDPRGP